MSLDQIKQGTEIRDDREFQLRDFEIAVISDQGAVILRSIRERTNATAVVRTLELRSTGAIARRFKRQQHVSER